MGNDKATGKCLNSKCGTVLYANLTDIPDGWIAIWHVDCNGYCPECAVAQDEDGELLHPDADEAKGLTILTSVPHNYSHQLGEAYGQLKHNLSFA